MLGLLTSFAEAGTDLFGDSTIAMFVEDKKRYQ
jgi:hypothetical protein